MPGNKYSFRVHGNNGCGSGPWSDILTVTAAPSAPETPEIRLIGKQLFITWNDPYADKYSGTPSKITGYQIVFKTKTGAQVRSKVNCNGVRPEIIETRSCRVEDAEMRTYLKLIKGDIV